MNNKDFRKDKLYESLDKREKMFLENFFGSKTGNFLVDFMNYQNDIRVYGYTHQRYLEVLGESYLK